MPAGNPGILTGGGKKVQLRERDGLAVFRTWGYVHYMPQARKQQQPQKLKMKAI